MCLIDTMHQEQFPLTTIVQHQYDNKKLYRKYNNSDKNQQPITRLL